MGFPPFFHKGHMANETLTSELDAVNIIISTIGESPVSTLTGELPVDVSIAKSVLVEASRAVQSVGWHFNTDVKLVLALDVNSQISLPGNTLQVDASIEDGEVDLVQHGIKLYDRLNRTYTFAREQTVDITYFHPWDILIEQARRYILIHASKLFQGRMVGSDTLWNFSAQEEFAALTALLRADGQSADFNIFRSASMRRILGRRESQAGYR